MKISSPAFNHATTIPSKYTCDGKDISPPLKFDDVPENSKSLVLLMEDPDVPWSVRPDGMWDHWIVFNIPPQTQGFNEDERPKGVYGVNTKGKQKYNGPCPPDREHRYFFKLYALDISLRLPPGVTKKEVEQAMKDHVIAEAELIGKYERKTRETKLR